LFEKNLLEFTPLFLKGLYLEVDSIKLLFGVQHIFDILIVEFIKAYFNVSDVFFIAGYKILEDCLFLGKEHRLG
jgi:hypothetical protein